MCSLNPLDGCQYVKRCKKLKTPIDFIVMENHMSGIKGPNFICMLSTDNIKIAIISKSQFSL